LRERIASTMAGTSARKSFFSFSASRLLSSRALGERLLGALRDLLALQDADVVDLLPLAVETEQRPDLEEAGRDVDGPGQSGPVPNVLERLPVLIAVIDDKEFAARAARSADLLIHS